MPYKDPERQRAAQREYEKTRRGKRHRVWTWIMYDESSPDWKDGLESIHVPCLVSPVHNRDVWTRLDERRNPKCKAGGRKKEHRHGLAEFEQPITYDEFMQAMEEAHVSTTNVKWVRSVRAMSRYLTHMDSPDKARYADDEVTELSGASWAEMTERAEDFHAILREMREFIVFNEVTDLWRFQMWTDSQPDLTWSRALDSKVYGIDRFIGSFRAWLQGNDGQDPVQFLLSARGWSRPKTSLEDMEQCTECGAWVPKSEMSRGGIVGPEGHMHWVACPDCARDINERLESWDLAEQEE